MVKILGRPRVQLDVTVEEFINRATERFNLPRKTPEGVKIDYQLIVNGKPIIDPLKKFEDLKVSDGTKVMLSKKMIEQKPIEFKEIIKGKPMLNQRKIAIIALTYLSIGLLIGSSIFKSTVRITLTTRYEKKVAIAESPSHNGCKGRLKHVKVVSSTFVKGEEVEISVSYDLSGSWCTYRPIRVYLHGC